MKNETTPQTKVELEIEKETDGQLWIAAKGNNVMIAKICHGELPNHKIEVTREEKAIADDLVNRYNMHKNLIDAMRDLVSSAQANNDYDCDRGLQDATERAEYLISQAEQK